MTTNIHVVPPESGIGVGEPWGESGIAHCSGDLAACRNNSVVACSGPRPGVEWRAITTVMYVFKGLPSDASHRMPASEYKQADASAWSLLVSWHRMPIRKLCLGTMFRQNCQSAFLPDYIKWAIRYYMFHHWFIKSRISLGRATWFAATV